MTDREPDSAGPVRNAQESAMKRSAPIAGVEDPTPEAWQSWALIDAIPQQIWSGPADGTLDYCNERWRSYMGLGLEDLQGDGWQTMLHPDDRDRVLAAWHESIVKGTPYEQEERHRAANGAYRWFLARGVPLRDAQGRIVRWYGTNTDIEDRKRAEYALRHSIDQLRALAGRLQSVREEERARVARQIHDELGQALTGIKLESVALIRELPVEAKHQSNRAESIAKLADETIQVVRRISTDLRPGILDDLGLVAAVEWAVQEFGARTGTKSWLDLPKHDIVIDPELATALFRILQETLTNVARHALATRVDVRLAVEVDSLTLDVRDDGKGISEDQLTAGSSLGILGMRERAVLLGGELTIHGSPGQGTTVSVRIPCTTPYHLHQKME
jgi:two-component system, NarL family, sensor histidine kinase UhpB